jgi:hypothetical protein
MSQDQTTVEAVLATLHGISQPPPRGLTDKLASVTVGTPEAYYLLATYCFDLTRKLEYLTKVAASFADQIPPALAEQIHADTEAINDSKVQTWQERAEAAEKIMIRLHRESTGERLPPASQVGV